MSTASAVPKGMPAHLWEIAKRDASGLMPDRLRRAADTSATAPGPIRAFARRAAALAGVLGPVGAIAALTSGHDAVATAASAAPLPGHLDPAPSAPGASAGGGSGGPGGADGGPAGHGGHVGQEIHGDGGATGGGLGSTWHVGVDDGSGHQAVLQVQMFQDAVVTETADGQYVVDAVQVIRIVDPHGHEHVFTDHYEVVVPDPPGQETDLVIHENAHVHLVENPDGSFTPVVDHEITVTPGADGDGHDEVTIDQDESLSVRDHDPHHGEVVDASLSEKVSSTSDDTGDEATSTVHQNEGADDGDPTATGHDGGQPVHGQPAHELTDRQAAHGPSSAPAESAPASSTATSTASSTAATTAAPVALSVPESSTGAPLAWHADGHHLDPTPVAHPGVGHSADSDHPAGFGGDTPHPGPGVAFAGTTRPDPPEHQVPEASEHPEHPEPEPTVPEHTGPEHTIPEQTGPGVPTDHETPEPTGHEHAGHGASSTDAGSDHAGAPVLDHAGLG